MTGLIAKQIEFPFPTGDKADIYMQDAYGRVVGVEIEVEVGPSSLAGPLQALKYRAMLELLAGRSRNEGRAFLVAYKIAPKVRRLCEDYGIECFQVQERAVRRWAAARGVDTAAER
jgi:RecB family endonuclease NucS